MHRLLFIVLLIVLTLAINAQVQISDTLTFTNGKLYYLHNVKPKQTLYSIAKTYGVKVDDVARVNNLPKKEIKNGQLLLIPSQISPSKGKIIIANENVYSVDYHTVKKGETFYKIAKIYGISSSFLQGLNPEINEASLKEGYLLLTARPIKISKPQDKEETNTRQPAYEVEEHVVKKGETLYTIARQYSVNVEDLKKANPGLSEKLSEGQKINIPVVKNENPSKCPCEKNTTKRNFTISILFPLNNTVPVITPPAKDENWKDIPEFEYVEFYLGFKMAMKELETTNFTFKIKPILFGTDTSKFLDILKSNKVLHSDVVISLLESVELQAVKGYLKNVPLIQCSLEKDEAWAQQMPNLIQLLTPVNYQLKSLAYELKKDFPDANFILVHRNDLFFTWAIGELSSNLANLGVSYQIVNAEKQGNASAFGKMNAQKKNVIVVFESNEFFVKEFLRQLFDYTSKANFKNSTALVGLAGWMNFDYIDFEFLEKFNAMFFGNQFVDYSNEKVLQFVKQYQDTYHADPGLRAFGGYDVAYFIIPLMKEYGKCFFNCLNKAENDAYLSLKISLEHLHQGGWVNTGVQFYEMKNFYFWKKQ